MKTKILEWFDRKTFYAVLFVTVFLAANILSFKFVSILWFTMPVGTLLYPITFLVTDAYGELYGLKEVRRIVIYGFIANLIMLACIGFGFILPGADYWTGAEAFNAVFMFTPKVVAASLIAYLVSQMHDVYMFDLWKRKTKGKYLWLRNNASTVVSQLIDTLVLMGVLFLLGAVPITALFAVVGSHYLVKIAIAFADTPFCYLMAWKGKK
ncbi:MAG: queuosine precursor transporter [Candidatus Aenigmarchaeota archaeon]|nr:queuosine precursor transporter [Candidatus Aenigmarchaeota archaeon]